MRTCSPDISLSNTIVHVLTRTCSSVTIWVNKVCTSSQERPHKSSVRVIKSCTHSRERALKSSVWVVQSYTCENVLTVYLPTRTCSPCTYPLERVHLSSVWVIKSCSQVLSLSDDIVHLLTINRSLRCIKIKSQICQEFFLSMCDVKIFFTFTSPNMVLLWQLFYLFCSCI